MKSLVEKAGVSNRFEIDSAGIIDYHEGELPDARMRSHARRRGYELVHRSRPVRPEDFDYFDLIIGMDSQNLVDLRRRAPSAEAERKIARMTDYCVRYAQADSVPDPYYGGAEGFEYALDLLEDACAGLLERLE